MASREMTASEWSPLLGPVDRVSFFAEQRRNRRKARRGALWCGVVVALMGLGLSAVIMPVIGLLLGSTAMASAVLNLSGQRATGVNGNLPQAAIHAVIAAMWLLPGLIAVLLLWLLIRSLYRRGAGALAKTIAGARPPQSTDLKERQLCNVVQELAIAAGIEAPTVVLLDDAPPNAGIAGSSPNDATLIVSRRMLDQFDRDQTMGALAIVVASVANGDLYVLYNTLSLFEAFGIVMALVSFPFSPSSRRACWAFLKLALLNKGDPEVVCDLLLQHAHSSGTKEMNQWMGRRMSGWFLKPLLGSFIILLLLPWILMVMFADMIVVLVPLMSFGPLLALEWRDRRYLADATAVQLTRNPNAVAQAIVALTENGGLLDGQKWSDLLFVVGAEIWTERANQKYERALIENRRALAGASIPERMRNGVNLFNEWHADRQSAQLELAQSERKQKSWKTRLGFVGTFHPSINRRMLRLRALGANVPWQYRREYPIIGILLVLLFVFVGLIIVGAFYQLLMNPH